MFTGLIEAMGTVVEVGSRGVSTRLTVDTPTLAPRLRLGDSVAVSGVCLTALDLTEQGFSADLARETLERTNLAGMAVGAVVNLELPTPAGSPLGGHVVQGHVDGVGRLLSLEPLIANAGAGETDWRLRVQVPAKLTRYVVAQGSITLEGISLTVADLTGDVVSVAIIPHTYRATSLHTLGVGAEINVEVDVLSKYAERLAETDDSWTVTEEYLLANGY